MASHLALMPQIPGQGSTHLRFLQARFVVHSELTVHSGLHIGGDPKNVGEHEQIACPLNTRHRLFRPQGDGLQGSAGSAVRTSILQNRENL